MDHHPSAAPVGSAWQGRCSCNWRAKTYEPKEAVALKIATQHAELKAKAEREKGCGKIRYETRQEALAVLLDAKVDRVINGVHRRRERKAYTCSVCPGRPWHLTSKA